MGKVRVRGFNQISKKVGEAGPELRRQLKVELQESLEEGRDEARRLIEARGTGKTWVAEWNPDYWKNAHGGRTASRPGRVASGNMRDMMTYEMSSDSKYRVRGRLGWFGRLGENRYFMAQELGGYRHNITGQLMEGMFVLRDAADFVDARFEERAEKVARRIANLDF